jgi:hypothetical protein
MAMNNTMNRRGFAALLSATAMVGHRAFAQETGSPGETGSELPAADLPSMNEQGHRFEPSSTFEGNFDGVPTEAPVYKMELPTFTAEQVNELAERLGIEGEATDLGGGSFSVESRDGQLFVTQGRVQYISSSKVEDGDLPEDEASIATAREWLRERGLLPADVGEGTVLTRSESPKRVIVGFQPLQPRPLISSTPMVSVSMGADGQVTEAMNGWARLTQDVVYQLRGADFAWGEVEARRAWVDASLPTSEFAPGSTIGGAVVYTQLSLAYTTSGIPGENQYLQPVYVFHGELTPDGTDSRYQVRAYVPALINSNQPVG